MLREVITRFGRENLGVLWLVGEPMLFTVGVTALWTATSMHAHSSLPITVFAITGYSSVLSWRNAVGRCNRAIGENFNLLYHRNVQVLDVFIARLLLELAGVTASFLVLVLLFTGLGLAQPPRDPLAVVCGWLMLCWFGGALATTVGAACAHSELVDRLWHPVSYLMFPFSGAAFMLDWLPPAARNVVAWLPMIHGVEYMREGFFGAVVRTHHDLAYMATCNLGLTLAGLLLVRSAARRVQAP
ncbi:ABC transporter permease [Ideonella livida]|nr:ABC transporter permease [Ideonella livida]